jgi:outer membrane protein OmpA-like peptidoglycan-associated protein
MPSLIQTVMDALPSDASSKIAGLIGESPVATMKGIGAAAPALMAGALQRSSTPAGATDLLAQVKEATAAGNPLDRVGSVFSDEGARNDYMSQGQNLASRLLGGATGPVGSALSGVTGLGGGAASGLLAFLAPLVLGALGRATGPTPTVSGLQTLLSSERANILGALPPGLGSHFGLGAAAPAAAVTERSGLLRYLPWILAAIVALLVILGLRNCGAHREVAPAAVAPPTPTTPARVTLILPGGGTVDVTQGSIGFGVAKFLESPEPAPKTFVFDNLNFDTASNTLTPESAPTVSTLVAILKAYPNAQERVVGYTDNQGDPAANQALSEARAESVKDDLVKGGIDPSRIAVAGMGEANPIADNGAEEGRAKNRRTELEIVKK